MAAENRKNSRVITREYYDSLLIEARHFDSVVPSTECELFGEKFATPIATAALSHLGDNPDTNMVGLAKAAHNVGGIAFEGMGEEKELEEMVATGARIIKIIKPYADRKLLLSRIEHANRCGAMAVGIDIDHQHGRKSLPDNVLGFPMEPIMAAEMKEIIKTASIPFIVKGVLSVQDAVKSLEAGASGIVVSHHNGSLDYAVPPVAILPKIVEAVGGKLTIFVDCGIQSGLDAFKALCLGADAVCVGVALMDTLKNSGSAGVTEQLQQMNHELKWAMAKTCTPNTKSFDSSVIHASWHIE